MKKYLVLLLIFLLVGCGKINRDDYINYVTSDNNNLKDPLTASYKVFETIIKEDEKIDFPDFSKMKKLDKPKYVIYNYTGDIPARNYEAIFYDNEDSLLYTSVTVSYRIERSFLDPEDDEFKMIGGQKYKYTKLKINSENYYEKDMCLFKGDYTFCVGKIDSNEITNEDLLEYLKYF